MLAWVLRCAVRATTLFDARRRLSRNRTKQSCCRLLTFVVRRSSFVVIDETKRAAAQNSAPECTGPISFCLPQHRRRHHQQHQRPTTYNVNNCNDNDHPIIISSSINNSINNNNNNVNSSINSNKNEQDPARPLHQSWSSSETFESWS